MSWSRSVEQVAFADGREGACKMQHLEACLWGSLQLPPLVQDQLLREYHFEEMLNKVTVAHEVPECTMAASWARCLLRGELQPSGRAACASLCRSWQQEH